MSLIEELRQDAIRRYNALPDGDKTRLLQMVDERNALPRLKHARRTSEYVLFMDALRLCGIEHGYWHALPPNKTKEEWDQVVADQGFCLTSLAVTSIYQVANILFCFSTGVCHWEDGEEAGPESVFMFAYDMTKDEVIPRIRVDGSGRKMGTDTGLAAIQAEYNFSI